MGMMLKPKTAVGACTVALAAGAVLPAAAPAKIIELGQATESATPSCPGSPCFAVPRTTGFQTRVGEQKGLWRVKADGRIVAWSITLSQPSEKQTAAFVKRFRGPASAGIAVVRKGPKRTGRTIAVSPVQPLAEYFGGTVQFPLEESIPVERGWVVALRVPTWAPALAVGFDDDVAWRAASKPEGKCARLSTQLLQDPGGLARFRCLFKTARLTYGATLITSPKPRQPADARDR